MTYPGLDQARYLVGVSGVFIIICIFIKHGVNSVDCIFERAWRGHKLRQSMIYLNNEIERDSQQCPVHSKLCLLCILIMCYVMLYMTSQLERGYYDHAMAILPVRICSNAFCGVCFMYWSTSSFDVVHISGRE